MKFEMKSEQNRTVLTLHEQMTYADRASFDKLIPSLVSHGQPLVVDVADLNYMDSAGLGMLLSLRDATEKRRVPLKLCRPQGDVKELMNLSSLESLIPIEW